MRSLLPTPGEHGSLTVTADGEQLVLLATRAVYWPRRRTLLVADLHWGKAAAWRRRGVPIPPAAAADDLRRLTTSIQSTGARRLVLLGDLIHCRGGRQPDVMRRVAAWRANHSSLDVLLVRGNHDRHAGDPPAEWQMDPADEPVRDAPFVFRHTPEPSPQGYVLAGHVHPLVELRGPGAQRLRLPAFLLTTGAATLPAFDSLAGGALIRPARGDRVFVIADGEVVPAGTQAP